MKKSLQITLDEDLLELIEQAIALDEEQREVGSDSDRGLDIEYELQELRRDIGWHIVYDVKGLPQ